MTAPKHRPFLQDAQLGFSFEAPLPATREADLAGLDRMIASAVSRAVREDGRSQAEVAAATGALLDQPLTPDMLYAYASEARDTHNISAARFFALVAATHRFDILDAVAVRIGARVLVGEEVVTAELGHIDREIAELQQRKRDLQLQAKPIRRAGGRA